MHILAVIVITFAVVLFWRSIAAVAVILALGLLTFFAPEAVLNFLIGAFILAAITSTMVFSPILAIGLLVRGIKRLKGITYVQDEWELLRIRFFSGWYAFCSVFLLAVVASEPPSADDRVWAYGSILVAGSTSIAILLLSNLFGVEANKDGNIG